MAPVKASLIITTYNWPEALAVCLNSALKQSYDNFEILIADDGSKAPTADTVQRLLRSGSRPWRHVRHDDSGIRQARIKNLAVRYATGDYFIFIDHDVVLHPSFIRDHIENAQQDCFLQGKRVFLPQQLTQKSLEQGALNPPSLLTRGLGNRKNAWYCPSLGKHMARKKRFQVTLRGCNLSMPRQIFKTVDGYDETFDGIWGREDSDICYRMFHRGYHIKNLYWAGLQYHLDHPAIKHTRRDRLDEELDRIRTEKRTRALCGYSALSPEGRIVASSEESNA
jgi:glycosyltransferase involved in cell wall biosynthesis